MDEKFVDMFESLTGEHDDNWTMLECTVNGEESVAICQIFDREGTVDEVDIIPRFVGVTKSMKLVNSAGEKAELHDCKTCDAVGCSDRKGAFHGRVH